MSQQAAKRRRAQAMNGYKHIAPLRRPKYKKAASLSIHNAIERERRKAAKAAQIKRK